MSYFVDPVMANRLQGGKRRHTVHAVITWWKIQDSGLMNNQMPWMTEKDEEKCHGKLSKLRKFFRDWYLFMIIHFIQYQIVWTKMAKSTSLNFTGDAFHTQWLPSISKVDLQISLVMIKLQCKCSAFAILIHWPLTCLSTVNIFRPD